MRDFVVVPEGLEADAAGLGADRPSEAFRLVLERVAAEARPGDRVWLAPANSFGGPLSEQRVAQEFLSRRSGAELVAFDAPSLSYINTRGNAVLLRDHIKGKGLWPLGHAVLAVYAVHAPRAGLIFRQEGFRFSEVLSVGGGFDRNKPIVGRLWYIRYPALHRVYEAMALPAFALRLR